MTFWICYTWAFIDWVWILGHFNCEKQMKIHRIKWIQQVVKCFFPLKLSKGCKIHCCISPILPAPVPPSPELFTRGWHAVFCRLLVSAPWSGYSRDRKGDVYKCPISESRNNCDKLNLQGELRVVVWPVSAISPFVLTVCPPNLNSCLILSSNSQIPSVFQRWKASMTTCVWVWLSLRRTMAVICWYMWIHLKCSAQSMRGSVLSQTWASQVLEGRD